MLELFQIKCIECHYLHMPNPSEDDYICLKSLEKVLHELDTPVFCPYYEEIKSLWVPIYDIDHENYL